MTISAPSTQTPIQMLDHLITKNKLHIIDNNHNIYANFGHYFHSDYKFLIKDVRL